MRDLIREELRKFRGKVLLEEEEDNYYTCKRFAGNRPKYTLCRSISSTGFWLHDNKGLQMKDLIISTLKPFFVKFSDEEKEKFKKGVRILAKLGKISEGKKEQFIEEKIENNGIVKVNGVWHPVNKLNTNHRDLSEFLTDLISKTNDRQLMMNILQDPKKGLNQIKYELPQLIEDHFKDTQELFDYTKNIAYTSKVGEEAEEKVKKELQDMGFTVGYQGGDGDVIDMNFGTDLIMGRQDMGWKTIQVKRNEGAWDKSKKYYYVDWVIIADPFTIYDNKTKQPVEL